MDVKYNYINNLLPIINKEFISIAEYDPHLPMKLYLTYTISDIFAKSKVYLDYNLTEEESNNFTVFFEQHERLMQIPHYEETVLAIQKLYDIYRAAIQIQEAFSRNDDIEKLKHVAAEILPDYDMDALIVTLQITDLDIEQLHVIENNINTIKKLAKNNIKHQDASAELYKASKDIIQSFFSIISRWAQTTLETQLTDLWYYIDNSIGLVAGSRDKDIVQEQSSIVTQSVGQEQLLISIKELYITCLDSSLQRKDKITKIQEQIKNISDTVYKHPVELSLPFTTLVANTIDINKPKNTINVSMIIDNMLQIVWKSIPDRYDELAPKINALKKIKKRDELVNAVIDTYIELDSLLYTHDIRIKTVSMLNTALRKIDAYRQIPLLLYADGEDKTQNIIYVDKLRLIEKLKGTSILKPNVEYLLVDRNISNKKERAKKYLSVLMEERPEVQHISQSVINKITANIKEDSEATVSYQLLNMIINNKSVDGESVGLTSEERIHLADILPINLYVTLFFDLLKSKDIETIASVISNSMDKHTLEVLKHFIKYAIEQNNTNYVYEKGYGSQFINAAILTTTLETLKEYYLQNSLCKEFTYEISTDPKQNNAGEDFLTFVKIQLDNTRVYSTISIDSKSHSNCTPSSGSAPSNIAQSLDIILGIDDSITDKDIRRFFIDPDTVDQALQIVQEQPERFKTLNMFLPLDKLDVIRKLLNSIDDLVTKQNNIENQFHNRRTTYSDSFMTAFRDAVLALGYDISEDKTTIVNILSEVVKECNTLVSTLIKDSKYANNLFVLITTPDYAVLSEIKKSVLDIAKRYSDSKPIEPPKITKSDITLDESEFLDLLDEELDYKSVEQFKKTKYNDYER